MHRLQASQVSASQHTSYVLPNLAYAHGSTVSRWQQGSHQCTLASIVHRPLRCTASLNRHGQCCNANTRAIHSCAWPAQLLSSMGNGIDAGNPSISCSKRRRVSVCAASGMSSMEEDVCAIDADNFYDILGVSPAASTRQIKTAYKLMMKDFHPDLSGDEESTEFCILLNEIYETLMDPERRATYDALAGFSADSINPFADATLPADQVFVDEFTCIGCRNCTNVCPSSFAIEEDFGRARVMKQGVDAEAQLQEAIDTCPVNCIYWVTAPQLSLLEAAMARMERVAVWSLMSGGGGGKDVFTEASIAWEKRQAQVRAKLRVDKDAAAWDAWWAGMGGASAGANMYAQAASASRRAASASTTSSYSSMDSDDVSGSESGDEGAYAGAGGAGGAGGAAGNGKEGARIARLAAKAARAARQWKTWQEMQQRSRQSGLLLTASVSAKD